MLSELNFSWVFVLNMATIKINNILFANKRVSNVSIEFKIYRRLDNSQVKYLNVY